MILKQKKIVSQIHCFYHMYFDKILTFSLKIVIFGWIHIISYIINSIDEPEEIDIAINNIMDTIKKNSKDIGKFEEPLSRYVVYKLKQKKHYKRADEVLKFIRSYCSKYKYTCLFQLYSLILQYKEGCKNKCETMFIEIAKLFSKFKFNNDMLMILIEWW